MQNTHEIGRMAEKIAVALLESKGYMILHRNWRYYHKELDIVAKYNNTLVIVEVKSRFRNYSGPSSESVSTAQMRHIVNAAEAYINLYNMDDDTRFDLIFVTFSGEEHTTEHIEGAFVAGVNW